MDPYRDLIVSPRRAARAARERRIALMNPIRVERIRAVHRIDRRRKVAAFFSHRLVGALAFLVIVGCAVLAGLIVVRLWGVA
jgi:hypothetical protein